MGNSVTHDTELQQYRVHLQQDYYALVKYHMEGSVMAITHTRVPDELQGKGYGKVMMETVLPLIEKDGYKINPVCPYVAHYLNKYHQYSHLLTS
ncbi:GNAT family N-acetyltransferase [Vibrio maerlii]|uniref:GNAT family N-acetyltransferase n=1 Tax=Vibrio maerlii TaxID=2231648 RepID=UPI000E3CBC17|nr:GNAT family N-acetyltransferase [Vibrio maerlii]